jgi:hypothetical protein
MSKSELLGLVIYLLLTAWVVCATELSLMGLVKLRAIFSKPPIL